MILLYQIENTPCWPALQAALSIHKLPYRHIAPAEYSMPLQQLSLALPPAAASSAAAPAPLDEPMMIFCGLSSEQVSLFLDLMRRLGITQIGLKAMLTPTNQSWTSLQLYQELKSERAAFQNR